MEKTKAFYTLALTTFSVLVWLFLFKKQAKLEIEKSIGRVWNKILLLVVSIMSMFAIGVIYEVASEGWIISSSFAILGIVSTLFLLGVIALRSRSLSIKDKVGSVFLLGVPAYSLLLVVASYPFRLFLPPLFMLGVITLLRKYTNHISSSFKVILLFGSLFLVALSVYIYPGFFTDSIPVSEHVYIKMGVSCRAKKGEMVDAYFVEAKKIYTLKRLQEGDSIFLMIEYDGNKLKKNILTSRGNFYSSSHNSQVLTGYIKEINSFRLGRFWIKARFYLGKAKVKKDIYLGRLWCNDELVLRSGVLYINRKTHKIDRIEVQ